MGMFEQQKRCAVPAIRPLNKEKPVFFSSVSMMLLSHPALCSCAWHTPTDKGQDSRSEAETTGSFQGLFLL